MSADRAENRSDAPVEHDERQVSEIHNLRGRDADRGLQTQEGSPPAEDARQEAEGPPDENDRQLDEDDK